MLGGPLEKSKAPFEMLHRKLPETHGNSLCGAKKKGISNEGCGVFSRVFPPRKTWKNSAKDVELQVEGHVHLFLVRILFKVVVIKGN